jgi:hypothetical protein
LTIDALLASPMISMTLKAHQFQQEWQLKALVAQNPLVWAKELYYGCERVIMGRNMTFGFPILSVPQVHVADS